jgi:hypothetical protein
VKPTLRDNTTKKRKNYQELLINNLLASAKKEPHSPNAARSKPTLTLDEEYAELLGKISEREPFAIPELYFYK